VHVVTYDLIPDSNRRIRSITWCCTYTQISCTKGHRTPGIYLHSTIPSSTECHSSHSHVVLRVQVSGSVAGAWGRLIVSRSISPILPPSVMRPYRLSTPTCRHCR
jgi:hypothetical protein